MRIARHRIVDARRERGQQVRAGRAELDLPEWPDPDKHAGLRATLGLDPVDLAEALSP